MNSSRKLNTAIGAGIGIITIGATTTTGTTIITGAGIITIGGTTTIIVAITVTGEPSC